MSFKEIQKNNQNLIKYHGDINKYRLKAILRLLKGKEGKLLDVGCSDGKFIEHYTHKGFDCYGIDISNKAIRFGKKRGISIKNRDISKKMPYDSNLFDIITCGQVLEHLLDPLYTVKEMYRILKNEGVIIITVPNLCMLRNLFLIIEGKALSYSCTFDGPHYRDYCENEIIRLLATAGFRKIRVHGDKLNIPYGRGKLLTLKPYLPRYCDNLVVIAKK